MKEPENYDPRNLEAFRATQNAGVDPTPKHAHDALQNVDALLRGEGDPLPSTVILDYVYGIAAYNAWRSQSGDGFDKIKAYRDEHYAKIPPLPSASRDYIDDDDTPVPDDPKDSDYKPHHSLVPTTKKSVLEETMDELNLFFMHIQGITPEMAAERRQKEIEREERAAQEAGRGKVLEWRDRVESVDVL
jgi:hypothetical protein